VSGALWYLIILQLGGYLRAAARSLRTFKGALLALLGLAVLGVWLGASMVEDGRGRAVDPERLRSLGPASLLGYCLLTVLLSSGERAVYFTPAEVSFLFPGPFGRRELLVYKITFTLLIALPTTVLMLVFLRVFATWLLAAYVGILLGVIFLQLFSTALSLVISTLGNEAYGRGRWIVLVAVGLFVALALLQGGGLRDLAEPEVWRDAFSEGPLWRWAARPLRWFFDAFLATSGIELAQYALLALLVDLAMFGVVLALDAGYQEASASASARIYARLQQIRRGGVLADESGGPRRLTLPALPWWGGIGPHLWRQLTAALRAIVRLVLVFGILGTAVLVPVMDEKPDPVALPMRVGVLLLWLTVLLTALVPFDFRGDIERMAFLKTLPLPAWRLAVAQILTPALILTLVQWAVLAVVATRTPGTGWLLAAIAALGLPFNLFLFALENLLFLLSPTRQVAGTPSEFQSLGRTALFMMVKLLALVVLLVLSSVPMAITYVLTGHSVVAAVAAAWPVVALAGAALVPAVAIAFHKFDVGRDMPA
jgi:hypothetical protein